MSRTVLILDADKAFTAELSALLAARGDAPIVFEAWGAALLRATSASPAAILLSVELPGVSSGFAVANRLRRDAATAGIPLVLLSDSATEAVFAEHRKLRTRADVYLRKPVAAALAVEALDVALAERAGGAPPVTTEPSDAAWLTTWLGPSAPNASPEERLMRVVLGDIALYLRHSPDAELLADDCREGLQLLLSRHGDSESLRTAYANRVAELARVLGLPNPDLSAAPTGRYRVASDAEGESLDVDAPELRAAMRQQLRPPGE